MGDIKKILFNFPVFISDFEGWGREALPTGFSWGHARQEENSLRAENGDELGYQGIYLRRGNHLDARIKISADQIETLGLDQFFPGQELVIATCCEKLRFFAPVCRNKKELIAFLHLVQENADGFWMQQSIDLALWLYHHNPNKVKEASWGI